MSSKKNRLQRIRGIDATFPADIAVAAFLMIVLDGLVLQRPTALPLVRAVLGLAVVLFVPGYLLLAVLYPRRSPLPTATDPVRSGRTTPQRLAHGGRPSWRERIVLAFGLSLAIVPVSGLVIAPLTGSFSTWSVLLGLNAFVVLGACLALLRRNMVPAEERLTVPVDAVRTAVGNAVGRGGYPDRILAVLLLCTVAAAVVTTGFVLVSPSDGEAYTSASLLTENEAGELVASGYPATLEAGSPAPLTLRVENHEGSETTYTAVAALQRVDRSGASPSVTDAETVYREQATVAGGEAWTAQHSLTPTMTGEDLRLRYYVYRGEAPDDPSEETAYRTVSLWVTVESSG